jgi:hypothetical protein
MKDFMWVCETRFRGPGAVWIPVATCHWSRVDARRMANSIRSENYETRVRKYVRAGK